MKNERTIKWITLHYIVDKPLNSPNQDAWTGVIDKNSSRLYSFWIPDNAGITIVGNENTKPKSNSKKFFIVVAKTYEINGKQFIDEKHTLYTVSHENERKIYVKCIFNRLSRFSSI